MKRFIFTILIVLFGILFLLPRQSLAIEDPLTLPNNKMGVHILFTSEITQAANLVNGNGGDWGYVTIPIQAGDRDMEKWQNFMSEAKKLHVIPIVRLATAGDYFNTNVWSKPTANDILDFANFLNSLSWPVKNRYVVIFNEVNRSDEWEGNLDPKEYADLLSYSVTVFKSLDKDFFIVSGGLDNAAPNVSGQYMNEYDYMEEMNEEVPGIFGLIDGLGSHSYPNPGFKQMPYILTSQSIDSFQFEKDLAYRLSNKNLPVFITETGWSKDALPESQIGDYFKYAFSYVWSDKSIVCVTVFLLEGGEQGPFSKFSLTDTAGNGNHIFHALFDIAKIKGKPTVNPGIDLTQYVLPNDIPMKTFPVRSQYNNLPVQKTNTIEGFFKWLFMLSF
jgi:hypothetical protein